MTWHGLLCLSLHGMRQWGLSSWQSELLSFCSCPGCQWELEHEEIKCQDLPHPACSRRPPTLGHAALALVCRYEIQNTKALKLSAFSNLWQQPENFIWICPLFWGVKHWRLVSAVLVLLQTGVSSVSRQALSPEIQKSNFPMQLEPVVPKLVREEWDTKVKCLQWQSKTWLFGKALSSKMSCTLVPLKINVRQQVLLGSLIYSN